MELFIVIWSWMVDNPEPTAGFLTALVLAIGLYFAYKQLNLMKVVEQAKLITDMSAYWDSQIMRDSRKAIQETTKGKREPEECAHALYEELERCKEPEFDKWLELTRVGNFFEEMGNLAYDKALDLRIISGRFRTHITAYYDLYTQFIREKRPQQPTIYQYFIWLAKEIPKVKAKRIHM